MTACVNRKHTKKVAAVVTASLVGALSLGVAPVVAMADDGIAVQSVTATDALEGGTLTGAVDIDNKAIEIPATGEITFTADGKPQGVVPTEITMAAGNATKKIALNDFQYTLQYYTAHADFTKGAACGTPVAVGKYVVEMTLTSGDYAGATISVPFEIKAASLEGLTAVDSVDGSFEYDGTDQLPNIDYKIGDKFIDSSLFTVNSITYGFEKGDAHAWENTSTIKNAGDYSMVLVGKPGTIYAGSETEVKLTIDKLDLSDAVVVADDDLITNMTGVGSAYTPRMVSINGSIWSNLSGDVDVTFKSGPKGSNLIKDTGVYTYTVKAKAGNTNVEKAGDFTFTAVDAMATDFRYQGNPMPTYRLVDKSKGDSFTGDKIQVFKADGSQLNSGEYTVTVKNAKTGANATLDEVNTPGVWVVTVKVNAEANGYTLGGSATMTVTTIAGTVETAANLYFIYDGKVVNSSVSTEYDGSDKLDGLQVVLTDGYGNVLTEGTDYKVTVTDNAGNSYDSVVDAGKYTVTVTSDSYVIDTTGDTAGQNKLNLTVTPVSVEDVRIADGAFTVYNDTTMGQQAFLPYTGSAINPAIEYKNSEGEWAELPADLYTLTFAYSKDYSTTPSHYKKVDEMSAEGYYKVYLHAVRDENTNWDLKTNAGTAGFWTVGNSYDLTNDLVRVADLRVFADVDATYWAAQNIYEANRLGYMNGYNGTDFFGPLDNIKRGDVVVTLYKMAGQPSPAWLEDYKDGSNGYVTGFDDVDSKMYYAQAIAWAKAVGITTGDSGTNNFRPEDQISRQELAKMLCVYAEKTGKGLDVDTDAVLAQYDDENTVAEWARDYVAWAVEADIMGQDSPLRADDPINRAEVATMAVRLQPKKLDDVLIKPVL